MTRLFLPIILLAASLGLFIFYINPTYQEIKGLAVQSASYDEALTKSQQLRSLRDQLLATRASFSEDDVNKLGRMLPDNVDNIRLIIDINNIASRHSLTLSGISVGDTSSSASQQSALAVAPSGSAIGSVEVGFSVTTDYDTFLSFLADLEHSLRIVDVDQLSVTTGTGDLNQYALQIKTYWLH
jgi:Tfp pilus assembly protein PilO